MGFIDEDELAALANASTASQDTPIPLQMVSSDEYVPSRKSVKQVEVGQRLGQLADDLGGALGLSRRTFFRSASGMAAAFVAMNQTYGAELFAATLDEARSPGAADARAHALKDQFVIDVHTHFVHDRFMPEAAQQLPFPWRKAVAEFGWNPQVGSNVSMKAVQFANYHKEIYFDSDTKIALISSAPGAATPFMPLNNQQMAEARAKVNAEAGSRRMLSHAIFAPGAPGWEEDLDAAIALKPDSWKGYTIGSTGLDTKGRVSKLWPWRMDGEEAYKAYEKMAKSGITTVCVHKGLFPPSMERKFPHLRGYVDVSDVGQAAKDWPQLNFVVYHAGYRHTDEPSGARTDPEVALAEFERTGRISWVSDLAEIPALYGVNNVYADLGQVFGMTMIAQPRICAALLGVLIKGLGADKVCWGTDAVWSGSPQWQIEGLRRIEIPEDMRRRHGFAPLGGPTGKVKAGILANNSARLYGLGADVRAAVLGDRLATAKARYELAGREPSNRQYGFVMRDA
jgi:predicted TIM-barrel fold metal-dependent hydrolase